MISPKLKLIIIIIIVSTLSFCYGLSLNKPYSFHKIYNNPSVFNKKTGELFIFTTRNNQSPVWLKLDSSSLSHSVQASLPQNTNPFDNIIPTNHKD